MYRYKERVDCYLTLATDPKPEKKDRGTDPGPCGLSTATRGKRSDRRCSTSGKVLDCECLHLACVSELTKPFDPPCERTEISTVVAKERVCGRPCEGHLQIQWDNK